MSLVYPRSAAIVGAGAAGLLHGLAYRAHGIPIEGVFDVDRARAHDLAGILGARHVIDTIEGVASSSASCISITSPPLHHVAQAAACTASGRAVWVEKPVAVSAEELARLAALPNVVPIVQWRRGRALRVIRRAIADGALGAAPSVAVDLAWRRDDAYRAARTASAWGCGALLSIGVHALDAVCFALGASVEAIEGRDDPTGATLALLFSTGATGTMRLTLDAGDDGTTLRFAGGGVTATIEGGEADPTATQVTWRGPKRRALEALERATDGDVHGPLVVPFLGAALDALRRGGQPGESDALPSIRDVAPGHEAAMHAEAKLRR